MNTSSEISKGVKGMILARDIIALTVFIVLAGSVGLLWKEISTHESRPAHDAAIEKILLDKLATTPSDVIQQVTANSAKLDAILKRLEEE